MQGDRPARCPNHFFAVNEPSAVPWWWCFVLWSEVFWCLDVCCGVRSCDGHVIWCDVMTCVVSCHVMQRDVMVMSCSTPVLLCTTKYYSSTTLFYTVLVQYYSFYKVLVQYYSFYKVLLQYYPELQSTTPNLLQYYPVLQSTTPVLTCTTKYYSNTTLYYKVLLQYYSVLQSTTPILLRTTNTTLYYSSTTLYYKVLLKTYSVLLQYYLVLQSTTPVLQSTSWLIRITYETSFTISRATGITLQLHQILSLPRKMNLMIDPHHIWKSFTMRGATVNTLQPHQILRLPRKMNLMIDPHHIWNVIYNRRSNSQRPPTSPNTAPATQNDHPTSDRNLLKTAEVAFPMRDRSENDPTMIRAWSDPENAKLNPPRRQGYFSHSPGADSI